MKRMMFAVLAVLLFVPSQVRASSIVGLSVIYHDLADIITIEVTNDTGWTDSPRFSGACDTTQNPSAERCLSQSIKRPTAATGAAYTLSNTTTFTNLGVAESNSTNRSDL